MVYTVAMSATLVNAIQGRRRRALNSGSARALALKPIAFMLALSVCLLSGTALAETQDRKIAVFGIGPNGSPLLGAPPASTSIWVDTIVKTFIEGWTEYNPSTCTDISTGSYSVTKQPTHGTLYFDVENSTLANGDCPGITFPFAVARYTWTDAKEAVLQDPFTLDWSTPDGMFNQVNSFAAELAKVTQAPLSVWWTCSATTTALPTTGTLTLTNPPSGATSFVWTITAGTITLAYSNNASTITTTTNTAGIQSLAASTGKNDVSMNVVVQGLTYLFSTQVREPNRLKKRTDLDQDNPRGQTCAVTGTLGWQSLIGYEVDDQFSVNTATPDNANAGVNEFLGTKINVQPNKWGQGPAGGSGTRGGTFHDNVCHTGTALPQAEVPQNPLTKDLVDQIPQIWYSGSSATPPPNMGCEVQTDTINRYIDHGRHVNIKSPPSAEDLAEPSDFGDESSHSGVGTPTPVRNVRYLAEQSAVIVKGRVLSVTQVGTNEKTASFQADSVLKGNVPTKIITVAFSESTGAPSVALESNEYALLFLSKGRNESYAFADPQVGKLPITSRDVPSADAAPTTSGKLEAVLFASLSDPEAEVARTALQQVGNLGSVRSTLAIRDIAASGPPDSQGLAYIALLKLGDYSLLSQSIRFAEQAGQDTELQRLQSGVAEAIGDIQDKTMLPVLNALLASPNLSLRRAAAKALRQIGDPSSARVLVTALDDSDRDVQYDAVMALAELFGASSDNAPAREAFDKNPGKYVNGWKTWWEESGKEKYK
jgi:HEAT repeat protein